MGGRAGFAWRCQCVVRAVGLDRVCHVDYCVCLCVSAASHAYSASAADDLSFFLCLSLFLRLSGCLARSLNNRSAATSCALIGNRWDDCELRVCWRVHGANSYDDDDAPPREHVRG